MRQSSGVGWVGERGTVWLVTEAGGVLPPSVAVFQCSFFPLGTSVREVNAVLYVTCECFQNSAGVRVGVGISESCKHIQSNIL